MTTGINLIGDIAGRCEELKLLHRQMPKEAALWCLGDLVDRGPDSCGVVDYVMKNGDALRGNHEDMMLCELTRMGIDGLSADVCYTPRIWERNGGDATLRSYKGADGFLMLPILRPHAEWINSRWRMMTTATVNGRPGLVATHAPINPEHKTYEDADNYRDLECEYGATLLWNRRFPRHRSLFQVHGHNSVGPTPDWYLDADRPMNLPVKIVRSLEMPTGAWGVNLDTSRSRYLTGMHWPSMKIYQQPYLEY